MFFYFFIICQAEISKIRNLKLWPLIQRVPTYRTAIFSGLELQTGFVRIRLHSLSKVIPQRKESLVKVHVRHPRLGTQITSPISCDSAIGSFSCRFCRLIRQLPCQPQHRITGRLQTEFSQKRFQENFAISTWNSMQAAAESQSKVAECKTTQIAKRFNEIMKRFWKKTYKGLWCASKCGIKNKLSKKQKVQYLWFLGNYNWDPFQVQDLFLLCQQPLTTIVTKPRKRRNMLAGYLDQDSIPRSTGEGFLPKTNTSLLSEGNFEVKLPTIRIDGKAEVGKGEEKIRKDQKRERIRRKKMQVYKK